MSESKVIAVVGVETDAGAEVAQLHSPRMTS
jgi:hypothetical protein